jgi:hypothetical protein
MGQPCAGDARPGAYCDVLDVMSAMNVYAFNDTQGRGCGPGLAAPNLQGLGWLSRSRVVSSWPARSRTVNLAALNRPDIDGPLALQLGGWPFLDEYIYFEFRQAAGWDRGIGSDVVMLHTVRGDGLTQLLTNSGGGGTLLAGYEVVLDGLVQVVVRVVSTDSAAGTATIHFWPLRQAGARDVRITRIDFDPPGPDVQRESLVIEMTPAPMSTSRLATGGRGHACLPVPPTHPGAGRGGHRLDRRGSADANDLYWGDSRPCGTHRRHRHLRRPDGTVASQYSYGDGGRS